MKAPVFALSMLLIPSLSVAQPAKDVEMDCKGTLEETATDNEKPVSASVNIFAGHVIVLIESFGLVQGPIIATEEKYIRFSVQRSNFVLGTFAPKFGSSIVLIPLCRFLSESRPSTCSG
jgi:hypothetical protein